ncbi:MAG: MFS transporter [Clostridia bacterium]|nr:MFS transporter [Clostridia bacterium]
MNSKWNKLIFAVVYLAYTSIYIARVNLSMAGPDLIDGQILDTVQLGLLGSVFSTVYAVGRLINGGLSDKTPPWLMLATGLGVAGISNILVGFFPPFIGIFLLWTANAYAQSMLWSSVLCVVSSMYEKQVAKQKTSAMVTSVAMGNILGIVINTFLITKLGVRFAFAVPGILTLILGAAVFFTTKSIKPPAQIAKKHISMWQLLKNKELVTMCAPAMFHGVMKENISLWMTVYVVDKYSVDLSTSSYYILLIPVIGFIGRTIYPAVYKMCREKENTVSLVGFIISVLAAVIICISGVGMICAVLCLSVIYAAVSMINTSILSIYPLHYLKTGNVASVSGIMDFATYLGGGISGVIYGVVIKHFGYLPMFVSWAVLSILSVLLIIRINSIRKKSA